jgi:hypothetical protein
MEDGQVISVTSLDEIDGGEGGCSIFADEGSCQDQVG